MRAESKRVVVMYDHFDGTLIHDPELDIGAGLWLLPSVVLVLLALLF